MYRFILNIIKEILDVILIIKLFFHKLHFKVRYKKIFKCDIPYSVRLKRNTRFLLRRGGNVQIGNNTNIQRDSRIVIDGGNLIIGKNCSFGENNIINVFDIVEIGDNVLTADRVNFISNIHCYERIDIPIHNQETLSGPIKVGSGSWLGINVTILPNTVIGKNCVVGSHSVVKGNFPDYCVIAGVPAKVVKRYNIDNMRWEKERKKI